MFWEGDVCSWWTNLNSLITDFSLLFYVGQHSSGLARWSKWYQWYSAPIWSTYWVVGPVYIESIVWWCRLNSRDVPYLMVPWLDNGYNGCCQNQMGFSPDLLTYCSGPSYGSSREEHEQAGGFSLIRLADNSCCYLQLVKSSLWWIWLLCSILRFFDF